jgi:hypothetical protein
MSGRKLVRRMVFPLAMLGVLVVGASSAQAWTLHEMKYGGTLLAPGVIKPCGAETCWELEKITGNIAIYEGAGTVSVCQVTEDFYSGVNREGCGNNAVGNALNLTPYYGHYLWPKIKNNSPNAHTIRGVAYWGTP